MTAEGRWEIVRSDSGWRARFWRGSDIICWTEDYASKANALHAIESILDMPLIAMRDTPTSTVVYRVDEHGREVRMTDKRIIDHDPDDGIEGAGI